MARLTEEKDEMQKLQFLYDRFQSDDVAGPIRGRRDAEIQMAAAMLLYEAAMRDGTLDASERRSIMEALTQRFDMSASEAAETFNDVQEKYRPGGASLGKAAETLVERMEENERLMLMQFVERIVYSDGVLDPEEAELLNGIRNILALPNAEVGHVRREVRQLMKLSKHKEAERREDKPDMSRKQKLNKAAIKEAEAAGAVGLFMTMGGSSSRDDED
ncbi:MAG: hypothetical protein Alpg2KO_06890 [Alphaproteobacteria bacterium]